MCVKVCFTLMTKLYDGCITLKNYLHTCFCNHFSGDMDWSYQHFHLILCINISDAGRWKTLGGPVVIGGENLPSPVQVGLTDLQNIGGASGPPGSGTTAESYIWFQLHIIYCCPFLESRFLHTSDTVFLKWQ